MRGTVANEFALLEDDLGLIHNTFSVLQSLPAIRAKPGLSSETNQI